MKQVHSSCKSNKDFFLLAIKSLPLEISAKFFSPTAANFSASTQSKNFFLGRPELFEKQQKPKINYMAADGST